MKKERPEAVQREARCNTKINALSAELHATKEAFEVLSADLSSLKFQISLPKSLSGEVGVKIPGKKTKRRKVASLGGMFQCLGPLRISHFLLLRL